MLNQKSYFVYLFSIKLWGGLLITLKPPGTNATWQTLELNSVRLPCLTLGCVDNLENLSLRSELLLQTIFDYIYNYVHDNSVSVLLDKHISFAYNIYRNRKIGVKIFFPRPQFIKKTHKKIKMLIYRVKKTLHTLPPSSLASLMCEIWYSGCVWFLYYIFSGNYDENKKKKQKQ